MQKHRFLSATALAATGVLRAVAFRRCLFCYFRFCYRLFFVTVCVVSVGKYCRSVFLNVLKGTPPLLGRGSDVCPFFGVKFWHRFLHACFADLSLFWLPFGLHFGTVFGHFGITFSSIVFTSIFHQKWDGF